MAQIPIRPTAKASRPSTRPSFKALLEHGSRAERADCAGRIPLIAAILRNPEPVAARLALRFLAHQPALETADRTGLIARDHAQACGFSRLAAQLTGSGPAKPARSRSKRTVNSPPAPST